ncbi:MAG: 4-hydroxy-3-methylbut-2-enyl diphosphate reductase [Thermodesulfobacteriota bacterium]
MKVILAKKAGFCMGVRRAMDTVLAAVKEKSAAGRPISTFGPLIHNQQVLDLLADKGVSVARSIGEIKGGTVVIRAHGIPPQQKEAILQTGARVVDGTCLRVIKVQTIIRRFARRGYQVIIVGDEGHPEVSGLLGFAVGQGILISSKADIARLPKLDKYIIVAQTTQDENLFNEIASEITSKYPGGQVFNTICHSTHERQAEVLELCEEVEAVVVVGGKESANTKRLAQIAEEAGVKAYHIETENDLDLKEMSRFSRVAVTAGASTPNWIINRVVSKLESVKGRQESALKAAAYSFFRFLLESNLYISLGAGFLAYTSLKLQGIKGALPYFSIASAYIYAVHNLNHFTDKEADAFSDPGRAIFFARHEKAILLLSLLAAAFALSLSYSLGLFPFLFLSFICILGTLYGVKIIPDFLGSVIPLRRLKDIPGSRTLFIALAWAAVAAFLPAWGSGQGFTPGLIAAFFFVSAFVFVRSALLEVFDVQADRMVGRETLPILIGERSTLILLKGLIAFLVIVLAASSFPGYVTTVSLWLILPVLSMAGCIVLFEKKYLRQGIKLEFLIENNFVLAGLVSYLWAHI